MDSIKKGNLLVILAVTIIAFGTSTAVASFTDGDEILNMLNITRSNGTTELMAVGGGNFTPLTASQIIIQVQNSTNETNSTNVTNNNTNSNTTTVKNVTNVNRTSNND